MVRWYIVSWPLWCMHGVVMVEVLISDLLLQTLHRAHFLSLDLLTES